MADVVRELIADHTLPAEIPVGHVEVRRITLAPNTPSGPHTHDGPVVGVIETGSVLFQIEDGETVTLRAGDTFCEPADTRISRFDATEQGVRFLAWFPMPAGRAATLTPLT